MRQRNGLEPSWTQERRNHDQQGQQAQEQSNHVGIRVVNVVVVGIRDAITVNVFVEVVRDVITVNVVVKESPCTVNGVVCDPVFVNVFLGGFIPDPKRDPPSSSEFWVLFVEDECALIFVNQAQRNRIRFVPPRIGSK